MTSRAFDYVVVGAGSSGCALARRLSDRSGATVALIEAGAGDERPQISAPSEYFTLWGSDLDWNYDSVAQPGTNNRVHRLPRGRVLGGTSAINGMVYLRGASSDYDAWAESGCSGWDWEAVRGSFEELEAVLRPAVLPDNNPLSDVFIAAAEEAGFPPNPSFDSGTLDGVGWNRSSIANGARNSSFRAFIAPILTRPNLTVLSETTVDRLIVDAGGSVSGLEVRGTGGASAERISCTSVILCAGAFESPRILMASGIGPAVHLNAMGIAPIVDLPVGENLIDHLLIGVVYNSMLPITLAHSMVTECCAFGRYSPTHDAPDIEISFAKEANFAPPTDDGVPRYTIIPGITQPRSRGTVRLRSADPREYPVIDPRYLTEPEDTSSLIEGIRMTREIGNAKAFADWNGGEFFPGTAVASDAELRAYISDTVSTWFHPVGTCRMGVGDDAVVDPRLQVRGTTGLHVADASIMPDIVSVNTNAASTMIGWRAADLIPG